MVYSISPSVIAVAHLVCFLGFEYLDLKPLTQGFVYANVSSYADEIVIQFWPSEDELKNDRQIGYWVHVSHDRVEDQEGL